MSEKGHHRIAIKTPRLKACIVGPYRPYRGGVAQYNNQLFECLEEYCDVFVVSFRRMYPGFLYPGVSDKDPDQGNELKHEEFVYHSIDVYKPISLNRTARIIAKQSPDVVFITWWTLFWQPGLAYIARYLRKNGIKVVYICHNIFDHDANPGEKLLSSWFLRHADGYIVHSSGESARLKKLLPNARVLNTRTLPIGGDFPTAKKILKKRGDLELLFFGFIRPYKGLDVLLDAISQLSDEKDVYTTIVGEPWKDKEEIQQVVKGMRDKKVELNMKYVSAQEAAEYFERADVVVLPYKSGTGSAVASQAFFYDKPILGTRVSGIEDVVLENKTGWLVKPGSAKELAKAINSISRKKARLSKQYINEFRLENSWPMIAKKYIKFFESL